MARRLVERDEEVARLRAELSASLERVARLEAAVRDAPMSIMSISGEQGRYEFANQAFASTLGRALDDVLASDPYETWTMHTHPDDIAEERAVIGRMAKSEIDRFQMEKRIVQRGGEVRWVRTTAVASRDPNGRLKRVIVYYADINEQRTAASGRERLEADLRQAQKMEALGKLAGAVAHDFNNRLLIITGYAELIREGLAPDSALVAHADAVLASAKRSAELTNQLLAYSRRQVLRPKVFDLNQAVDNMRNLFARLIDDCIDLVTTLAAKNTVFCDLGQIEQVIMNLALNARDAMPEGGRLTLETADVTLKEGEDPTLVPGDYVSLTVGDEGMGISDEVLPHVFEPFYTTKGVGQGTGLGLSVVEGIVHQSGGAVRVTTRAGQGTRFTVYLPRARDVPEPVRYTAVSAAPRDLSFETVLVCDDDDHVRRLLVELLELRAYRVLQARNGRDALELAGRHRGSIDLLVTDVVMPKLGGVALANELRKRHPCLRVLYVSGYAEDDALAHESLGRDTQFLAKPFSPGDFTRAVFAMLERQSAA
jgi:PAS domain S-box-containing protein